MNEQTRDFIRENADKDIRTLALSAKKCPKVDMPFALDQIAGRQTARHKLPTWAAADDIVYPPHLSMEQCSSEQTAKYKAELVNPSSLIPHLSSLTDLTGGFGVDFSFMSRGFQRAVYVERQEHLCDIARHNFALLGMDNAEVVCGDGVEYLREMDKVSLIYLDPARRNEHGGKTYAISDCTPDVTEIKDLLMEKADRVIVKLSPMLDWRKAIGDLRGAVSEVHIVSADNECKELLLVMEAERTEVKVVCVNIHNGKTDLFEFETADNLAIESMSAGVQEYKSDSSTYIYEPNASIMKAGCFSAIEQKFGIKQLEHNSHLFAGDSLIENFPGRKFRLESVSTMNKKDIKRTLHGIDKANIAVRNFPMSVAELRKRLKIKEGGSDYIFATTLIDKSHVLLLCSRV